MAKTTDRDADGMAQRALDEAEKAYRASGFHDPIRLRPAAFRALHGQTDDELLAGRTDRGWS